MPSLEQCVKSLIEHVARDNKILFINDCGPEADTIESQLKLLISGYDHISYERNTENMGFIKTCNRGVFELDNTENDILLLNSDTIVTDNFLEEMIDVLYLNEKHGAVCPRSSNATIASVPFRYHTPKDERDPEYAYSVYQKIKDDLPRFTVTPVAVGFCILIRRILIKNFGLFDPIYTLGYSEENDFCFRINKYGYSSIIANRSFVYHLESKSFTSEKKRRLVENNEQIMRGRYPYFQAIVDRYINSYIDPVDWFADLIASVDSKKKVLINLYHLPMSFNGTSRNALSMLEYLSKNRPDFDITLLAQKDAAHHYKLDRFGFRVIHPNNIQETFHVGYVVSQVFHIENLILMNRYCLKIVVSDLDIIGVRTNKLLAKSFDIRTIFFDAFRFADSIISISDFTKNDTLTYFQNREIDPNRFHTIHQGFPGNTFGSYEDRADKKKEERLIPEAILREMKYLFVMGNSYDHKAIDKTLDSLSDIELPIVVFGVATKKSRENVYAIDSGNVSDSYLEMVLQNSYLIIFPSLYEGFGFPIAEAAYYDKPIILADTSVSHEIADIYKNFGDKYYYSSFDEIPQIVNGLSKQKQKSSKNKNIRMLDNYNADVVEHLDMVLSQPSDLQNLRDRWTYFTNIEEYRGARNGETVRNIRVRFALKASAKFPKTYKHARSVYRRYFKH